MTKACLCEKQEESKTTKRSSTKHHTISKKQSLTQCQRRYHSTFVARDTRPGALGFTRQPALRIVPTFAVGRVVQDGQGPALFDSGIGARINGPWIVKGEPLSGLALGCGGVRGSVWSDGLNGGEQCQLWCLGAAFRKRSRGGTERVGFRGLGRWCWFNGGFTTRSNCGGFAASRSRCRSRST